MSKTVEYAVLTRRADKETIDWDTVTTDIERVRRARDCRQIDADFKEKNGIAPSTACVIVMRTCTPWCEVYEQKKKDKK